MLLLTGSWQILTVPRWPIGNAMQIEVKQTTSGQEPRVHFARQRRRTSPKERLWSERCQGLFGRLAPSRGSAGEADCVRFSKAERTKRKPAGPDEAQTICRNRRLATNFEQGIDLAQ